MPNFREKIEITIGLAIVVGAVVALLGFAVWASIYHYQDCKKVGHTATYCILDLSK